MSIEYLILYSSFKKISSTIEAPAYLIDLMNDKNAEVRRVCGFTLDIISVIENCI